MHLTSHRDLAHNLVLPTLLFAALGGMTWAVRGSSGYGAMMGCVFAGVTWGVAWWFIARRPGSKQSRRYSSGWIILALTVGIGIAGKRGWMQWPSFFEGHLQTNYAQGRFVPISRAYGFLWLFIAGVPWAGLGACMLAWCGSSRPLRPRDWAIRLACGLGMALLARILFEHLPGVFLPLYNSMQAQYHDLQSNPNLRRLINDNRAAIVHLGLYIGFLSYEIGRRDWKNAILILTVGLLNGTGWALCQNWKWAPRVWPGVHFNWWRCWESSGGISIGIAYGVAYYLVNRPEPESGEHLAAAPSKAFPNLERFGAYLGLVLGLGLSIKSGLKGWANLYLGNEEYWNGVLWMAIGPMMIISVFALVIWIRARPAATDSNRDVFPHAYRLVWLVLIIQNLLAQLVTGPFTVWTEMVFKIYYVLLFLLSAVIFHQFRSVQRRSLSCNRADRSVLRDCESRVDRTAVGDRKLLGSRTSCCCPCQTGIRP